MPQSPEEWAHALTTKHARLIEAIIASQARPNGSITSARVTKVTPASLFISFTSCRGDLCEMGRLEYPWNESIEELYQRVSAPQWSWLVTDPLALIIWITCGLLGYGTLVLGRDGMVESISHAPRLEAGIETVFLHTSYFAVAVTVAFWFSVVAHGIEAFLAIHQCRTSLGLHWRATISWAILISSVGYPIFSRLTELVDRMSTRRKSE